MGSHASAQLFFNPPAWPQQVRKPGGTVGHGPRPAPKEKATLPMPLLMRMQQHQQAAARAGFKVPPYPGVNLNTVILPANVHPDVRGVLDEYRTPPRPPVPRNFTPSPLPTAAYARIRATMEHWATNYTWAPGDEGMHYTMIYPHELVPRPCADLAEAKITLPAHFDLQQYARRSYAMDCTSITMCRSSAVLTVPHPSIFCIWPCCVVHETRGNVRQQGWWGMWTEGRGKGSTCVPIKAR